MSVLCRSPAARTWRSSSAPAVSEYVTGSACWASLTTSPRASASRRWRSRHADSLLCSSSSQNPGGRPGLAAGAGGFSQPGYLHVALVPATCSVMLLLLHAVPPPRQAYRFHLVKSDDTKLIKTKTKLKLASAGKRQRSVGGRTASVRRL